jgi:glycosyltransferase involved in cell wall biosynthesis
MTTEEQISLSVVVLTYNEEANIERCLGSVRGLVQESFVVDSGSTDRTVELAEASGAVVVEHPFVNQAQQMNWALDNLPLRTDWVIRLDADEWARPELVEEVRRRLPTLPDEVAGVYVKRRLVFLRKWIRHGGYYPTWLLRIFRKGAARSDDSEINEHIVLHSGTSVEFEHDIVDEDMKGVSAWITKHQKYAERHARFFLALRETELPGVRSKLFGNQVERRRWITRNIYGRVPLFVRPFLYFVYCYVVRLGFLDGIPGLVFCVLHDFWYRFYVDVKIYEMKRESPS